MKWNEKRNAVRERFAKFYDAEQAAGYEQVVGKLNEAEETMYLSDLQAVFAFEAGMRVLDVGAGSGSLSSILMQVDGLHLTALEPSPHMLNLLRTKPKLTAVDCVEGCCDAVEDRAHFPASHFDVIGSRQVVNGLFDPLTAFANWMYWLKPGGAVVAIDGLYGRNAWQGDLEEAVDMLPMSACQNTAMLPYLLEKSGFEIESAGFMEATNRLPSTRTTRYVVVARKPLG